MFIKEITDIQKFATVNRDLEAHEVQKYIVQVEFAWLNEFFSPNEINILQKAFDEEKLSAEQSKTIDLINSIVVPNALILALNALNAGIGATGARKTMVKNENFTEYSLTPSENLELKNDLLKSVYLNQNRLMIYLQNTNLPYNYWRNSENLQKIQRLLIPSESEFSKIINLGKSFLTFFRLSNLLSENENILEKNLGKELFLEIKTQFFNKNLFPKYKEIVKNMQFFLVYKTMSEGLQTMPIENTGNGFEILPNASFKTLNPKANSDLVNHYQNKAEYYLGELQQICKKFKDYLPLLKQEKPNKIEVDLNENLFIF